MDHKLTVWVSLGLLASAAAYPNPATATSADLILYGGRVMTLVDSEPEPSPTAVVVAGQRIIHVGDDSSALGFRGPESELIPLDGAVVVPGFIDAHAHLYGLGKALAEVDLNGTRSPQEVVNRAAAQAATLPDGVWLQGRGWDQNDWGIPEFPDRSLLDRAIPDRPVYFRRVDGHAVWVNSEALRLAGITVDTPDTVGGRIVRDARGEPTGILIDNASELVRRHIPPVSEGQMRSRMEAAITHCHKFGITSVHVAGAELRQVELYKAMARAGELGMRLYVMLADDEETLAQGLPEGTFTSPDHMLTIRAVKLYADGALGSRGALLLADYSDDPGNQGLLVNSAEHLSDVTLRAGTAGFQVCTHAIGDGGNRLVLDVYEEVLAVLKLEDPRWRIEHAQLLHPNDIPRFAQLGVIASMQPVHCTSDMDWVGARIGSDRERTAYAWRSLCDAGARICFGTDFPVEKVDPLAGLYAARTRTHSDGLPAGGWHSEQCLDGWEALSYYTADAAYAAFQEELVGKVQPGMLADLTVLSGDPVSCQPAQLLQMKTILTVVGGKIRYDARGGQ